MPKPPTVVRGYGRSLDVLVKNHRYLELGYNHFKPQPLTEPIDQTPRPLCLPVDHARFSLKSIFPMKMVV